jgi:hypothetical protein
VAPLLERSEREPAFGRRDAETVRRHLARCAPCADRHGRRLASVVGLVSLHERSIPDGLLDDLYATVRARAPFAPPGGGMSEAFLDGPRALALWRGSAVAAALLLAVGAAWTAANGLPGGAGPRPVPVTDVRNHLLPDFDQSQREAALDDRFSTVSWPRHRTGQSFWVRIPPAAPRGAEAPAPKRD